MKVIYMKIRPIKVQKVNPCKGNNNGKFYLDITMNNYIGEPITFYNVSATEAIELIQKIEEKL